MRIFLDDPNAIKQLVQTVSTASTTTTATTATTVTTPNSILVPTFFPPLPPSSSILSTTSLLSNGTLNGFHSSNLLVRDHSTESTCNLLSNEISQVLINDNVSILPSSSPLNGMTNKSKSRAKSSTKVNSDKSTVSNQSRHSTNNPQMTPYELPSITLPSKSFIDIVMFLLKCSINLCH
jgi:hypothetical protein